MGVNKTLVNNPETKTLKEFGSLNTDTQTSKKLSRVLLKLS